MPQPILALKLSVPSPRPGLVPRPRLATQLDGVWQPAKRLILVCAPAGYGKSSLVASWVAELQRRTGASSASPAVGWLSLDEADNNLSHFLLCLIEALKQALTFEQYQTWHSAIEQLEGSQAGSARDILTALLNGLSESPRPLLLVLDDYHYLTNSAVNHSVQFLLANLPPNVRLLLATRVDPPVGLAKLRARNQIVEIRTVGLQFTLAETADFLNRTFGLSLTEEQIALLASRTEGWAAGLQMAALSLQGHADPAAFIQAFGGSQRFILEYLLDEVLSRQPPDVQAFLLKSSIFERLCAEACDSLLGQPQTSQGMLETLERLNLFLIPLDDEGRWYRYHHLFASLLRSRLRQSLPAAPVGELYRRASQWYESQGLLVEAIAQALAAPDQTYAADLLEREVLTFFYHSQIAQVHHWLERLPPALIDQRALLCAVKAAAIALLPPFYPESLPAAEKWMQIAERALPEDPQHGDLARAFIYGIRSYWARFRDEPADTVLPLIANALALLPADSSTVLDHNQRRIRSALQTNLGFVHWAAGNETAARQAFTEARQIGRDSDDLFNESAAANMLVGMSFLHGELEAATRLAREALAQFGPRVPVSGEIGVQLAGILIEWNKLDEAEPLLKEYLELAKWTAGQNIFIYGHLALARLSAARGQPGAAFAHLDEAEQISSVRSELVAAQRAWLWLQLSGQHPEYLERARQWAQKHELAEFRPGPPPPEWPISLVVARLLAAASRDAPRRAELLAWLQRQERAMQALGWAHWEIQLRLTECLVRRQLGDRPGALAALGRSLELAAPGGYVRMFVDEGEPLRQFLTELGSELGSLSPYLDRLLTAFAESSGQTVHAPVPVEGLVEPLTAREMDVLQLICQGLSNQAIAEKLVVTISTVKKHNYSLFGKLGVSNRAQAIIRARQLGLSR